MEQNGRSPFLNNTDQVMVLAREAAGQDAVIQVLWSYDRPIVRSQLAAVYRQLCHGPLARSIIRRRLPIGRDIWSTAVQGDEQLTIGHSLLASELMNSWMDEEVDRPLDPFDGPAWRLSCQSFDNGKTLVALTISHCIADGGTAIRAVLTAIANHQAAVNPEQIVSETSLMREILQFLQDSWALIQALPQLAASAVSSAIKWWPQRTRHQFRQSTPFSKRSREGFRKKTPTRLTSFSVSIAWEDWLSARKSSRTDTLSLVVAIAGSLAKNLSRTRDGFATFFIPVNPRISEASNAANNVHLAKTVLPIDLIQPDLSLLRRRLSRSLIDSRRKPDFYASLLPLVPLIPQPLFRWAYHALTRQSSDLPISVSHMGELSEQILAIDGTPADDICFRGVDRRPRSDALALRGGVLTLLSARIHDRLHLNFVSHQPDQDNSIERLRSQIHKCLNCRGIPYTIFPR